MKRLAIITTHPIQYNAPLFRLIGQRGKIKLKVFYTWSQALEKFEDPDFGQSVQWDIPLLEGYEWEAVNNVAKKPSSKSFFGVDNPDLIQKIKAFKPDAILVFGWNHKSHLKVMRHFKGKIPIWFRGDSTLLDYDFQKIVDLIKLTTKKPLSFQLSALSSYLKFKLRTLFLKQIYKYVDKAFYVGTHNKAYYLHHGLKEEQLVYAPHAVDNDRFFDNEERQYEKKAREWRRELGFNDDDIVLLFAGKFYDLKNPELLTKATNRLTFSNKQQLKESTNQVQLLTDQRIKLLMVGNGPLEEHLKNQAKCNPNIIFLPFQNQSQMPILYRVADIFVLPSRSETWGLAINEALACNRKVIASNKCGGAIDLLINKDMFANNNIQSFINTLLKSTNRNLNSQKLSSFNLNSICIAIESELNV